MTTVIVSPEYQIALPLEAREKLNIRPGQKLDIIIYDGQMRFVPVEPIESLFGVFKDSKIPYEREKEDRLL